MPLTRKIIHIDMDAFYASVEQRDFSEYRGKPVIVGGQPNSRGVVAACSYEARRFGIHSAMPSATAYRACPQAIFVKPRFEVYRQVSAEIQAIFRQFTSMVEPLSLDEAYLDVSECRLHSGSATLIAKQLKSDIKHMTGLIASAGVSYNKFLAKVASDMDKPDGLYVIKPEQGEEFVSQLPIRKFFGIGRATETKMHSLGIYTGTDLKTWSREALLARFGKVGNFYYSIARGIDKREVNSQRVRKSISAETTFTEDLSDVTEMLNQIKHLAEKVGNTLADKHLWAKTLIIKVKFDDFSQVTRSKTLECPFQSPALLEDDIKTLLESTEAGVRKVRLLGAGVSGLLHEDCMESSTQIALL